MSYIGQQLPADVFSGYVTDTFTGDGSATTFTLSKAPFSEDSLIVVVDNVIQQPTTNFTVSGTTLTIVGTAILSGIKGYAIHTGGAVPSTLASKVDVNGLSDGVILDADADTTISADTDDQIDFKAGGTDIMSLTATTVAINDNTTITTDDNTDTLSLISTDADANVGPVLRLYRNSASAVDNDVIGNLIFSGNDTAGNETDYLTFQVNAGDADDGQEDGFMRILMPVASSSTEFVRLSPAEVVFNEGSADLNFRVEGNGDSYLIFADAGTDRVYMGYYTGADVTDACIIQSTDQNEEVTKFFASSGTYAEDVIHGDCTRAATSSYNLIRMTSNGNNDSEMICDGAGRLAVDGDLVSGGADYAEFFEWKDGNSSSEDRVGYSVVLDSNKIVKATDSDDASKIIGVISGVPAVVGDGDIERWKQKYLRDDYGREIWEEYTITEWQEEQTNVKGHKNMVTVFYETDKIPDNVTPPSDAVVKSTEIDGSTKLKRRKLNPDWNKDTSYISRVDRKEWDTVGLMGKLRLKKGQPTGTNWIKMRDISETVEEWLVR